MNVDPDIKKLQDSIQRSKVDRAKELTFEERFRAGADLFDEGMRWMRGMIESQNPEWSTEEVEAEVERRKQIRRKIDDAGFYQMVEGDSDGTE
jgi:hypothetical protein